MGSFRGPGGRAAAHVQSTLLRKMANVPRSSVVSVNALVDEIRATMQSCTLTAEELATLIAETAMLLGLIPVLDRSRLPDDDGERGKRHDDAGRQDRDAFYGFKSTHGRSLS